ncbi:transposase (fragment) [Thiomonas sp. X19]|uniref:transposase n=1 Tax=Thiomonas sp. X19 TaxID=1050370 RepID=UPI000B7427C8
MTRRQLQRLAASLQAKHPGAATSLREGLDATLTVQRLGIPGALYRTLHTTHPIENLNGHIATFTRNVQRWRDGQMLMRRVAAAWSDAKDRFRKLRGYRDMQLLRAVLQAHAEWPAEVDSGAKAKAA